MITWCSKMFHRCFIGCLKLCWLRVVKGIEYKGKASPTRTSWRWVMSTHSMWSQCEGSQDSGWCGTCASWLYLANLENVSQHKEKSQNRPYRVLQSKKNNNITNTSSAMALVLSQTVCSFMRYVWSGLSIGLSSLWPPGWLIRFPRSLRLVPTPPAAASAGPDPFSGSARCCSGSLVLQHAVPGSKCCTKRTHVCRNCPLSNFWGTGLEAAIRLGRMLPSLLHSAVVPHAAGPGEPTENPLGWSSIARTCAAARDVDAVGSTRFPQRLRPDLQTFEWTSTALEWGDSTKGRRVKNDLVVIRGGQCTIVFPCISRLTYDMHPYQWVYKLG